MTQLRYSICITEDATEMPRCFSISIQSEVAWRAALRALTEPAMLMAPENSSSFSVRVVLPASGWEMMAKVRRRRTCWAISDITLDYLPATLCRQRRGGIIGHASESPAGRQCQPDRSCFQVRAPGRRRGGPFLSRAPLDGTARAGHPVRHRVCR